MPEPGAPESQPVIAEWHDALSFILAGTRDLVCVIDSEATRFQYLNPSAEAAIGATLFQIQKSGCTVLDYIHPQDHHLFQSAVDATTNRIQGTAELRINRADGQIRWLNVRLSKMQTATGAAKGICLLATDVTARGIDVPTITHVFNFGLPMKSEDYTHRIGRTGRAGRKGLAVTLAEFREKRKIFDIESFTRQPFTAEVIPGLEPTQRLEKRGGGDRDYSGKGGKGRGGFGGKKFGARSEGQGYGRFEPRFEGRRSDRGNDQRFEERRPTRGFEGGRGKFEGRQHAGFEPRQDKRFEDRRPPSGGAGHFERREAGAGARSPFEKHGRAGAPGKSFGGGFDAKKRAPKPRSFR